jgi:hypothetical protein
MSASLIAEEQLTTALAWVAWGDVWLWLKWILLAPGNLVLLLLMKVAPSVAMFLQINPTEMASWLPGLISGLFWLSVMVAAVVRR